jgi:hypothetical protein
MLSQALRPLHRLSFNSSDDNFLFTGVGLGFVMLGAIPAHKLGLLQFSIYKLSNFVFPANIAFEQKPAFAI